MIVSVALAAAIGATTVVAVAEPVTASMPVAALPADANVGGRGYADLAATWWRWAYRRRDGMRPYQDPTGSQCHVGQTGAVWFLAGTAGTGAVERRCAVPENTHVFFPVLVVMDTSKPGRRRDCAALRTDVGKEAARPVAVRVELDGVALAPVRAASRECFDAYADAEDDAPPAGMYAPAFTDGFWMLLPPLGPGEHRLVVDARQAEGGIAPGRYDQRFTYVLEIGGERPESPADDAASTDRRDRLTL